MTGHIYFWGPTGSLLATRAHLAPRALLVLVTATPGLAGQSGP